MKMILFSDLLADSYTMQNLVAFRAFRRAIIGAIGRAALAFLLVSATQAQRPTDQTVTGPAVIARDESSRVGQYTTTSPNATTGRFSSQSLVYTELEDGFFFLSMANTSTP